MRWRVGNGEKNTIWKDAWVPGTQSHKIVLLGETQMRSWRLVL